MGLCFRRGVAKFPEGVAAQQVVVYPRRLVPRSRDSALNEGNPEDSPFVGEDRDRGRLRVLRQRKKNGNFPVCRVLA